MGPFRIGAFGARRIAGVVVFITVATACGTSDAPGPGNGGNGGAATSSGGAAPASGGAAGGGATSASGGAPGSGGTGNGGATSGGVANGGSTNAGGASGGAVNGGASSGGSPGTGGATMGGGGSSGSGAATGAVTGCRDESKNGTETDVDCGGECPPCVPGLGCRAPADCTSFDCAGAVCGKMPAQATCTSNDRCVSGTCSASGRCVAPAACSNQNQDPGETGIDCGGPSCPRCATTSSCQQARDCRERSCVNGACAAPSCSDGVRNGEETSVDCGGTAAGATCDRCGEGRGCRFAADCAPGLACVQLLCRVPTCTDGAPGGDETGVDCGGPTCPKCRVGTSCKVAADCASGACSTAANPSCTPAPTCANGVKDGEETDVDCGGPQCLHCVNPKKCLVPQDCGSLACTNGVCPLCVAELCPAGLGNGCCRSTTTCGLAAAPTVCF